MPINKNAKYYPLYKFLNKKKNKTVVLVWAKIEKILGFNLPKSALTKTWWSSIPENGHYHAYSWVEAGFKARLEDDVVYFSK